MDGQFVLDTLEQVQDIHHTVLHHKKEIEYLEIQISDLVSKLERRMRLEYVGFENKTPLEKVQNWSDMNKPITTPDSIGADLTGKLTEEPEKPESIQTVFPTMDGLYLVASPRGSLLQLEKRVLGND